MNAMDEKIEAFMGEVKVRNAHEPEFLQAVREVAETISNIIPGTNIEYIPDRDGELGYRLVSSEKTKDKLGWEATTSFEDGVNQTIDWYKLKI